MKKIIYLTMGLVCMSWIFAAKGFEDNKISKFLYLTDIIQKFDVSVLLVTDEDMNQSISKNSTSDINMNIAFFLRKDV